MCCFQEFPWGSAHLKIPSVGLLPCPLLGSPSGSPAGCAGRGSGLEPQVPRWCGGAMNVEMCWLGKCIHRNEATNVYFSVLTPGEEPVLEVTWDTAGHQTGLPSSTRPCHSMGLMKAGDRNVQKWHNRPISCRLFSKKCQQLQTKHSPK